MDPAEIRRQFDAAASPSYGEAHGGFHSRYAERLVELTPLAPGMRVLDAATGTGLAALAAARIVGETGYVLGIDIAERMVDEARALAAV